MKTINKTSVSVLLAFAMLLAFAGCKSHVTPAPTDPTEAPELTEAPTAEPSAVPTEVPKLTEAPTAEPSAIPTEVPELTEAPTAEPSAIPTEVPLPEDPEAIGDSVKDAETVVFIPSGDGEDHVGYAVADGVHYDVNSGPDSFAVVGETVYLADTINDRIIIYSNGRSSSIAVERGFSQLISVIDDVIYVSFTLSKEIIAYDLSGSEKERIELPRGAEGINALTEFEGRLALLDHALHLYSYEDGSWNTVAEGDIPSEQIAEPRFTFILGDRKIDFDTGENTRPAVYRFTDSFIYLSVYGYDPKPNEEGMYDSEFSYRVYDYDGNLVGCTYLDPRYAFSKPRNPMYIASDGTLYVMSCMNDGVYITKPNLRMEYASHLGETKAN